MREDKPDARPDPAAGKWRPRERGASISEALATRVRAFAFEALAPGRRATSNLYLDRHSLPKGTRIGPKSESWVVERDSVLCFADHYPRAAFAHPCSYYLHDLHTGELYRRIPAEFPPHPMEGLNQLERFHRPVPPAKSFPLPTQREGFEARMQRALSGSAAAGKRYAILFAGECEPFHVNDLELSYRTLLETFHFEEDKVFVLVHDGTKTGAPFLADDGVSSRNWPGDNTGFTLKPFGSGSREAFQGVLDRLQLTQNDLLFIHTAGHGGTSYAGGGQYLRLRPDGSDHYFSYEMRDDILERVRGSCHSLLVFMNQCCSGGFSDSMIAAGSAKAQRTFFAAACGADDWAHSTDDDNWSAFALNWYEAEMQRHIDPLPYMPGTDDDGDGKVEASEAYDYCVFMNTVSKGYDSPVRARLPAPDPTGDSLADQIALL